MYSTPVIGADGTIYFADDTGDLVAVNHNGTLKWNAEDACPALYDMSPAIGADGTIYCPEHEGPLKAFTDGGQGKVNKKWELEIGDDGNSSPAIGTDGTIYITGCWSSSKGEGSDI